MSTLRRREREKKLHKLIPPRTGVVVGCVEAFGKVAQPESLRRRRRGSLHCATAESSPHAFMNLLLACHYGWRLWQSSAQGQTARGEGESWCFSKQPSFPPGPCSANRYFLTSDRLTTSECERSVTAMNPQGVIAHLCSSPSLSLPGLRDRNFAVWVSSVSLPWQQAAKTCPAWTWHADNKEETKHRANREKPWTWNIYKHWIIIPAEIDD